MSLIKPFSEAEQRLIAAMRQVWQEIAPDVLELCENGEACRDEVVEMVCDAGRISTYGGKDGEELDKLQLHLYCNDEDRYLEVTVEAFPEDTYI